MRKKRQVCFRSNSTVANWLGIATDTPGAVLCRYRVAREGAGGMARLDVRFGRRFVWGVLEKEFEFIPFSSRQKLRPQA